MTDLTPERIEAALGKVQELEAAASPAPWQAHGDNPALAVKSNVLDSSGFGVFRPDGLARHDNQEHASAAYAALARNIALPALEALMRLHTRIEEGGVAGDDPRDPIRPLGDWFVPKDLADAEAVLAELVRWKEAQDE